MAKIYWHKNEAQNTQDTEVTESTPLPVRVYSEREDNIQDVRLQSADGSDLAKAEDTPHKSGDKGFVLLAVRESTASALADTDGDYIPIIVDGSGRLHIAPAPANDGVDIGDVDVTSVIPGTGATNLGKAIDGVAGATDSGVAPLAVRDDALGALTPVEGDYVPFRTDANGALWTHDDALDAALAGAELQVDVVGALPAGDNNIGNVDIVTLPAGNLGQQAMAASLSTVPANNITDATYIGDIKFGEALPAGSAIVGKVGIDQTTPGTTNAVVVRVKSDSGGSADAVTNTTSWDRDSGDNEFRTHVRHELYNESTWDRPRNNHAITILASAARTATTNSADLTNYNSKALIVIVNVSSITDTPILTPSLQIKDSISGNYFTVWTAAATITTATTVAYLFEVGGIGGSGSFTEAVNIRVGRTWRFVMTASDADSATYSVSGEMLL